MSQREYSAADLERINAVSKAREPRCELMDTSNGEVWQDFEPTPRTWYDELELASPLIKVGHGAGVMDAAWFRRSPDADRDGPVRTRDIGGRRFFFCARPLGAPEGEAPRRLMVDKHHCLLFGAGRKIEVLISKEGLAYVRVVDGSPEAPAPELPEGWRLREIELADDWRIELPAPTETLWFAGAISYQGPVELP